MRKPARTIWIFAIVGLLCGAAEWGAFGAKWRDAFEFTAALIVPVLLATAVLDRYLVPRLFRTSRWSWLKGILVALACVWLAALLFALGAVAVEAYKIRELHEWQRLALDLGQVFLFGGIFASYIGSPAVLVLGAGYGELIRRCNREFNGTADGTVQS